MPRLPRSLFEVSDTDENCTSIPFARRIQNTMPFDKIVVPAEGEKITLNDDKLHVPDNPIICFIEGDGTGVDIWAASRPVLDAAVEKAYGGQRKIAWMEVYAGDKANDVYGETIWLPQETSTPSTSTSSPSRDR